MEGLHLNFTGDMILAAAILVGSYLIIFSEIIHRTSAAIIGAVVMILAGMKEGFYSQEAAIRAIDINTLLLLTGMMMVVAMLRPTGAFEYAAIQIARRAKGNSRWLLVYLCLAVSLISMVLDNVTTIIIFAPLTVLITRILNLNPMPYLLAEAMLSNIGGAATLVGDPPNLMIGSAGEIAFTPFLIHMAPPMLLLWLTTIGIVLFMFRRELSVETDRPIDLNESRAIKDPSALFRVLLSLLLIVLLFFIHHRLHLYPAFVTFIGLALALALLRPKPDHLFGEVNWSVLFFFAGLFVLVGGVKGSGLLNLIGNGVASMADQPGMLLATSLLILWISALLSAVVDNIPFTVTMIPIIVGLEGQGVNITPLWWSLAIGVGLGGNGSHIGATANIIAVTESERCGMPEARISPIQWLKVGLPTMLTGLIVVSFVYAGFFSFFL